MKKLVLSSIVVIVTALQPLLAVDFNLATDAISCVVGEGRIIATISDADPGPYTYMLYDGPPLGGGNLLLTSPNNLSTSHIFESQGTIHIIAGTYYVAVTTPTQPGGVIHNITLSIVQTEVLSAEIIVTQALSCPTSTDAILSAVVSGGNPPYSYLWGPGGEVTPDITVGQGIYSVTVNDAHNCQNSQSEPTYFFLEGDDSIPTALLPGAIASNQTICINTSPAAFTNSQSATGGWGHTYQWQDSTASGTWQNIAGATSSTYDDPNNLTETRYYRRGAISTSGCGTVYSNILTITVVPLPVPTISGPTPVCAGSTGNVYTTEAGMSNYVWTVSAGGTITAGGGAANNTVTVTWNNTGAQTVRVSYTNGNGCTSSAPTIYNVTVNPLPVPTISGPTPVCAGSTGNVYTTEAGMSTYVWTVSAGGTITAGGGAANNTVTITWNTAGAQTVRVNYTNGNGCTATTPTTYNVTVNPLPVPTISGPTPICVGSTGNVYTTEAGMSNYVWTVSAGGTITAGGGAANNTVTVTWNTAGAQTVRVNYTNGNGCTSSAPTIYNVTVNPLPVPTINGPTPVCVGSTGNVYTTEAGMSNYVWTVSAGGTITAGGGATNNTVTITWNTAGAQTVRVSYTNGNGCTAASPTIFNVTVNPLPVPTISGPTPVCAGSTGNVYTTEAGMSNYVWTVSAGGTITAGGGTTNNTVTITWNTAGVQTVRVNYTNGNGCTATTPTTYNVTVNSLPVPTIVGPTPVCAGSTGNVYTTEAGMSNYAWTVSAGGTITAGGGATNNTVTVTWNTAGAQTVRVNYTNGNGCTATTPTTYNVTVNPLPVPTISGPTPVCAGSTGNVYSTQGGMTNYAWTVSAGGTITSGGGVNDNTVTVTWNTAGAQTVRVNYTNGNGCTATSPTIYNVTVNPLPVPTISGPTPVCAGSTGNVYTTEAGMSNYVWTVSAGGTITAGGGAANNTVTVTWNTAGAQTVRVNYTNGNGCIAITPTTYNVTVNPLPVPTIVGPTPVCAGSTGNVYTTEAGMSNYVWTVSAGGTITAGGGAANNTVTITWNTAGAQTVRVNYTNGNGCTATTPTTYNVTVNPLPVPTISGPTPVCAGSTGNVYTTEAGMSNYVWTVSAGGSITAGGGAANNTVTVTWNNTGAQTVRVSYTNGNGCTSSAPTIYNVTVNPLPVPTISGPTPVCAGSTGNVYTTEAGMSNYVWTVSAGGTITAGGGTTNNTVTITWNTAGAQTVRVNYTNGNGCIATTPTTYNVTVNPLPVPTIVGPTPVCAGSTGNVYTTEAGMSNYAWTVSAGGTITAGGGAANNTVTVTWNTAGAQTVRVNYTNGNGCTATTPTTYNVVVNQLPTAYAGITDSVCYTSTSYLIGGASASNYSTLQWSIVSGSGTFQGGVINTINPTYNFGVLDYNNGNGSLVRLMLQANGIGSCASSFVRDTLEILLAPEIRVSVGSPAPFYIGPNTEIEVCLSSSGHQRNLDMGYYLVAPDGSTAMPLKKGPQEFNFFTPCTPVSGGVPGDVTDLCFTTELPITDTLDICTEPRPLTGTFAATGDWSTFYGMSPSEGGWAVMIKDTANNRITINDGNIIEANLTFIDTSTVTGHLKTINYESGVISVPIIELANTSYMIPRGLQVSCAGECDAIGLVNTIGGIPPYTDYTWSPAPIDGNGTDSVVFCAGTYSLTVTDAMGCTGTTSVIVSEPPAIIINTLIYTDTLSCFGDTTGSISVTASGGTGSLSYSLLPGNIPSETPLGGTFTNLVAGTYTVHIEDINGCYIDTTLTIYQRTQLVLVSAEVTDSVFCAGDMNGRIVAVASGGTLPYTFILEPGAISNSTGIFENLGPGSYLVSLSDANDCDTIISDTLILGVPIPLVIDTVIVDPILCNGDQGTMTVVILGGEAPYDLYVNGSLEQSGITDTAVIVRSAGNYDISVIDANVCNTNWATISLTNPPTIVLDSILITPITTCYTDPAGEIDVYATGGTGTIEYSIDGINYQTANEFTGLIGGSYTVFIRDVNGCIITADTIVASPPLLLGNPIVTDAEGVNLGSIVLYPTGGTPFTVGAGYRYSIDGSALTTDSAFNNLTAGSYLIHVEDSLGCPWDSTIIINEQTLDFEAIVDNPDCYGGTGAINVYINNGTPPYIIYLDGVVVYSNVLDYFRRIGSVNPGSHLVTVIDDAGRSSDTTVIVISPDPIRIQRDYSHVSCNEYNLDGSAPSDGNISYNAEGGAGGYTYSWEDTSNPDSVRRNLPVGMYTVTVTDRDGCSWTDVTVLRALDTLAAEINIYPQDPNGVMTAAELLMYPSPLEDTLCYLSNWHLLATHNYFPVDYEWNPDTLLDNPADYLSQDVTFTLRHPVQFDLTINNNRCMDRDTIRLFVHDTINMMIETTGYRLRDSIFDPLSKPLNLSATDGYLAYEWFATDDFDDYTLQNTVLTPLADQEVVVIGTTPFGCYEPDTVYVVIQRPIEIADVFTPNGDQHNDTWIIPYSLQYPDLEVFIFNRWGQQVFYSNPYGTDEQHTWDGTSQKNGKELPIGSYYYIIKPNDGEQEPLTGTVTIVR